MNKTYIVELTEKELAVLISGLIKERLRVEDKTPDEMSRITKEDAMRACDSAWAKLDDAMRDKAEQVITMPDLNFIVSQAKAEFVRLPADLHISRKRVEQSDLKHISLAMSVIGWLNSKQVLKKLANFEFTDHSYDYEESE